MNLTAVQSFMKQQNIDAWLLHDFRGSNPVLARLLGGPKRWTTRRVELCIPAEGQPTLLASVLDFGQFEAAAALGIRREPYVSWKQHSDWVGAKLAGRRRVAMEYSPGGTLPAVAYVDAGTVEAVRNLGAEVVSSADLIQVCVATWSVAAQKAHAEDSAKVTKIKDAAFELIAAKTRANQPINERQVQEQILRDFKAAGLETQEGPIVAVNAHSGDPHFEVSATDSSPIRPGDWVLIDLWARRPGEEHIFSDITWCGFVGASPTAKHHAVFAAVKAARDASLKRAQDSWRAKQPVEGWQLDDAARDTIVAAGGGFGEFIRHRTGHSLSPGPLVHGLGMNLDNLETRDSRRMLPSTGFTIEPGIYGPDFGVRLEINVFVDETKGPVVTSCLQEDIVLM